MCLSMAVKDPGRVLSEGEHAGYKWLVFAGYMGVRCGYVRVPPGHPWHGEDYDRIDAEAHGGLTFAAPDVRCDEGGEDDAWWIGFDTGHPDDAPDPGLPPPVAEWGLPWGVVRDQGYVEAECINLCEQAAQAHQHANA